MKKIISLVLAVLMLVSVVPLGVSGVASDDYTQWKQGDSEWNQSAAWPSNEYPGAIYNYMRDGGCVVTSLAMLLRHHKVITNSDVNTFNPWICNEELKKVGAFTKSADLTWADVNKAYSGFELVDYRTPYSFSTIERLYREGYACIINVGGHYVALKDVTGTTVNIMDPGSSNSPTLASYSNPSEIIYYKVTPAKTEIEIGDRVEFGSYLGEPITWRCVGVDENGPLMLSEKVLCFKSYDAKGNYANSYRRSNGSNNWAETTLRHWLNSYGEVDWSNRISVPSNENVYYKKGGYDKELGFLTSFSESELSCIKTVTLRTYLNSADSSLAAGGTSEYNLPYADYADFFTEDMASRGKGKWYINTTDRVFILDPEQTAMCYFNFGEEFAFNPGATEAAFENEKTGLKDRVYYNIWMRVPATQGMSYQNNGATIHTDTIHKVNSGVIANAEDVGVRPAFYLDVDKYNSLPNTPSTPTPCKHTNSVNKPQLDPNCIDIGFTAGVYCNDCETWISGHEVIAVGDHKDANKDGRCDTCMKQLSSASTPDKPEAPKKNIIQIIIDGVKTVVNNVVDFFKKLFRI